jgi:fatty acid CoA ligase FadD36
VTLVPVLAGGGAVDDQQAAVTVAGRSLGLGDLSAAAGAVAARLTGLSAVAVEASPSLETVVAVLGGLAAGVPVVPLAPDAGPLERTHILRDCAAPVLLAAAGAAPAVPPGTPLEVIPVRISDRGAWPAGGGAGAGGGGGGGGAGPDGPALILYTSGTTGPPKGVMLSAAAIAADLDALAEAWGWTPEDVLVHGLPLFHVHGLILGVMGALRVGCRLIHTGRPTPAAYAAGADEGGSLFFGVPTVWSRLAAEPDAAASLRGARLLVSGSAGLPVPVFERLATLAGQGPIERYGMTETLITLSARAAGDRRAGWVGWPVAGIEARLVDEGGQPVAADAETVGELQVRGPTMMDGYLGQPDATAAVYTSDGWLRTGDVAGADRDGWYRIVGRQSTDLIKTAGYRVGAGEVEAALLAHPGVLEAAVIGVPDDDLGQAIVGYVVADGVSGPELCEFVAGVLSVHKRPRRVELVAALPRNAMGKVQKARLPNE